MDERFIPLATLLLRSASAVPLPAAPAPAEESPASTGRALAFAQSDVVHELTLMRLAALEAFERSAARLLQGLAHDVLARELQTAPADLEALAQRAVATFAELEPVGLAVSPVDAERVHAGLPVRVDSTLNAGDLIVDVRDGALESHFNLRLQAALDRAAARDRT